ncbi:hypothetical protein SBV1_1620025 [Verrucomicrobia bacterium]|nr:hypothetical protein SBV1_1620025 [Verrucomicrobiota bacterium]
MTDGKRPDNVAGRPSMTTDSITTSDGSAFDWAGHLNASNKIKIAIILIALQRAFLDFIGKPLYLGR